MKTIYLVIPCYNEQEVLPDTVKHLREKMETLMAKGAITKESRVVFVDDGSKDNTWAIIERYHTIYPELFDGLKLSRNEGHQNALSCRCGHSAMRSFQWMQTCRMTSTRLTR